MYLLVIEPGNIGIHYKGMFMVMMSKERKEKKKKTVVGENTKESNSDGVLFEA